MRNAFTFVFNRRAGGLAAMVGDMQRLENAARLAMGDFEGPSILPRPRQSLFHGLSRPGYLLLMVVALGILTATIF